MLKLKFSTIEKSIDEIKVDHMELFQTVENLAGELVDIECEKYTTEKVSYDYFTDGEISYKFNMKDYYFVYKCNNKKAIKTFIKLLNDMDHEVELIEG